MKTKNLILEDLNEKLCDKNLLSEAEMNHLRGGDGGGTGDADDEKTWVKQ